MATINIHFFRKSSLEKIDYGKILEFFDNLNDFETYYNDDVVEIVHKDNEFNFSYRYLITKKSHVRNISKLDPKFSNINFLLEMPLIIPSFLTKEILANIQKLCRLFDLGIYHDSFDDVKAFNVVEFLDFFEKQRSLYIQENGLQGKITFDNDKLNVICKFQRSVDNLIDYYHSEVAVNLCYPIVDKNTNESGICYDWRFGTPIIFAPYVTYINIIDEENQKMLVRKDELLNILGKYLTEITNFLPDMYILKPKQAKNCKKELKKIKKIVIEKDYKTLRLCDVIEA
ncbi:MAG: hypothetical protein SOU07_05055 [Bacilli bacterium]|nr:hypothetical protein [Acholeplasmataceae bacterium]MDY2902787.1 hypothetical protein [Bacilli bacterium]